MNRTKFTKTYILSVLILLLFSCSEKPTVKYNIPTALKENSEAVEIIEDMALAVSRLNKAMTDVAQLVVEYETDKDDKSIFKDMGQRAEASIKAQEVADSKRVISEIRISATRLKKDLTSQQAKALDKELDAIEKQIGDIKVEKQ